MRWDGIKNENVEKACSNDLEKEMVSIQWYAK